MNIALFEWGAPTPLYQMVKGEGSSCPSVLHFVLRLSVEGRP